MSQPTSKGAKGKCIRLLAAVPAEFSLAVFHFNCSLMRVGESIGACAVAIIQFDEEDYLAAIESQGANHRARLRLRQGDRKSTRLNSSHTVISYAVFCLKKKKMLRQFKYYLTVSD